MTRIDPARISYVLASLSGPKGAGRSNSAQVCRKELSDRIQKNKRSTEVLRACLQDKLCKLKRDNNSFVELAPIVTVQEILRWEFGDLVLEKAGFETISIQIAKAMLEDKLLHDAIFKVISSLA